MRPIAPIFALAIALGACASTPDDIVDVEEAAPVTEQDDDALSPVSSEVASVERDDVEVANDASWTVIFDGRSLRGWEAGVYGDSDELEFTDDGVVFPIGVPMTGITWRGDLPTLPYSIEVDATKQYGGDFFMAVTFPVHEEHLTLVLGGWGGMVCGLSNLDGKDASGNDTRTLMEFPNGKRQLVRIDVSESRVVAFVGDERVVDAALTGRELSIRPEVEPSTPLGLASFATVTTVHRVRIREAGRDDESP